MAWHRVRSLPWSSWERHAITLLWAFGIRVPTIATLLGRSRPAIRARAYAQRLGRHPRRHVGVIG